MGLLQACCHDPGGPGIPAVVGIQMPASEEGAVSVDFWCGRRYRRPNYTSERSMSFSMRFVRSPTAWSACQGSLWLETRERHRCRASAQLRNFSPDAGRTRRAVDAPLRSKGTDRTCPGDNTTVRHHWC